MFVANEEDKGGVKDYGASSFFSNQYSVGSKRPYAEFDSQK